MSVSVESVASTVRHLSHYFFYREYLGFNWLNSAAVLFASQFIQFVLQGKPDRIYYPKRTHKWLVLHGIEQLHLLLHCDLLKLQK